jgi:hypothetical protein
MSRYSPRRIGDERGRGNTLEQRPVEGHVNRLKTIKRQIYGRAGFAPLKARVVNVA